MTPRDEHALAVLFRQESGRLVAYLARFFGVRDLATAEDVAQETLLAALQSWSEGLPAEPTAWLFTVAKNRARDVLRRRNVRQGNGAVALDSDELAHEPPYADADGDLLRMMFSCCHPLLTEDTQTALILRLVCGFGTTEVAHAFFSDPRAMDKRLARAKKVLADEGRLFDVTTCKEAHERKAAVMNAVYLMFDAGYHSSVAPEVVRSDVAAEAIRLAALLAESRATTGPAVQALAALTCLHGARLPARFAGGVLVPARGTGPVRVGRAPRRAGHAIPRCFGDGGRTHGLSPRGGHRRPARCCGVRRNDQLAGDSAPLRPAPRAQGHARRRAQPCDRARSRARAAKRHRRGSRPRRTRTPRSVPVLLGRAG